MNWKPGKGLHATLNESTFKFLQRAFDVLEEIGFDDDMIDADPKGILDALEEKGWKKSKDKFGDKRYCEQRHGDNMLRVTIVLTGRGLALDVRLWYTDEA